MSRQVTVTIPDSPDEIARGVKEFEEALDAVRRLTTSIQNSLLLYLKYIENGEKMTIKLGGATITILGTKNGINVLDPETHKPILGSKWDRRLALLLSLENFWLELQNHENIQHLMIQLQQGFE